ncbi:MAG TPA: acylphosphatase [Burkholderiales bacterium]|nr:acylphosphatase [Burkholderiales bacterium]
MITRRLLIHGLVQGVGYRAAMRAEAERLGLTGWVRNRADGSVEAVVHGPAEMLERLIGWARSGPPAARVGTVRVCTARVGPEHRFVRFELLPTE